MENTRTHTNKGMYYLALITCAIFVLSEYCPELHILDQLHFKHILLSIAVFIFGWDLIDNRKNRCLVYEVKQILTCVGILYFITVIFQVKNMEFKSYSLGEVYYLIAPLLLVWIFLIIYLWIE